MNWGELRQRQPRERNGAYCAWIARQPCVACMAEGRGARRGVQVCHLRIGSPEHGKRPTGAGEKPDDLWTTPMCEPHHRRQHTMSEPRFWGELLINPFLLCKDLKASYDAGADGFGAIARHAGQAQRQRREIASE